MKVSEGFSMADSQNLPKVDYIMMLQFMRENDAFNVTEIRGAKVLLSSRESYVDTSIGYVEVKRENPLCYIKGRVTPEHKVRCKLYSVVAIIDEVEEIIKEVKCEDCAASQGGCKHSICFLMWLIRRTEDSPVTSVDCYWARPKLSDAVSKNKCILAKEMGKRKLPAVILPPILRLPVFLAECKKRKIEDSLILNYNSNIQDLDCLSIFRLMLEFVNNSSDEDEDRKFEQFKMFSKDKLTEDLIREIESETRNQSENVLWHSLRQGRVSASKIYEATKCKTMDGVLIKSILGGYKVPETRAIMRGKQLEKEVIKEIENEMDIKIEPCGFILISPFVGASPDGICKEKHFTVEIKCPSSEKTMNNYVKDNVLSAKCKAQVQLQMCAAKTKKGLFCIADPKFEDNKIYYKYWQYYDKRYVNQLLSKAEEFWKDYIFKKVHNIAKC